ncbi:unnamed protein product, partial [Iphiclides podalirius]
MEALKESLVEMSEQFQAQMEVFRRELHKGNPNGSSTSSLAAEFNSFKKCILAALTTLHSQVDLLRRELDRNEMRRRKKMILLHGIPEEKAEDTSIIVSTLITNKLQIPGITNAVFSRCHRLGRPSNKVFRPVVVKFHESSLRDKVWFPKTKHKGSGITQSEFLTRSRHNVFMEARRRYGVTKCWTRDGVIHLFTPDCTRHHVESLSDNKGAPRAKRTGKK